MRFTRDSLYKGLPVVIAMGFDIPVQGYFMTIEPIGAHPESNDETGFIYSNLDDPEIPFPGMTKDLTHYRAKLRAMEIDVGDFVDRVEASTD